YIKSAEFFGDSRAGSFAFVSTNSICQGESVSRLFPPLFKSGWRISFAWRSFKWDSQAPGKAGVTCVIVGFDRGESKTVTLGWENSNTQNCASINPYLLPDSPNVIVYPRSEVLSQTMAPLRAG